MKLCPQCQFIYENDQILCDMDGAALVYNPTPFPVGKDAAPSPALISSANDQVLCDMYASGLGYNPTPFPATTSAAPNPTALPSTNSQWWRFAATAVVGVGLGIALLYQISVQPTALRSRRDSAAQVTNNSPEQLGGGSALPVIDELDPSNLDIAQPVPLAPPIDVAPAPSPRKYSSESQSSGSSLSAQLLEKLKSTPNANSGNPEPVKPSPASARSRGTQREERTNKSTSNTANRRVTHQEKGSSIGSFLKKTGRIFKKPFKL